MDEKIQDYFFIELNNQTDGLVKICPVGEVIGIDRRVFVIDGETVLKNSIDRGIDIALNKNHYDSEAYGWFPLSSLVLKDDGIYGKLELNNLGKVAVENKHFRYLSPELNVNQLDRTVQSILAVGLVNSPNLLKKSLNNPNFGIHYLRNIVVSAMAEQGLNATYLSGALGHSDLNTIKKYLSMPYKRGSLEANKTIEMITKN